MDAEKKLVDVAWGKGVERSKLDGKRKREQGEATREGEEGGREEERKCGLVRERGS